MLSQTLESELSGYRIGEKIHELRTQRGLKLAELGAHSGLSAAMLSKIERGRLIPTLPTLTRIALVFSVGLEYFFTQQRRRHAFALVRSAQRRKFPAAISKTVVPYLFESLDYEALEPKLSAYLAHFRDVDPRKLPLHKHPGVEFMYVITGRMELTWGKEVHALEGGDSVYFDSTIEHGYRRVGARDCTAVVVTRPAT